MRDGIDAIWISVGTLEQKKLYETLIPSLCEMVSIEYHVVCDSEGGDRIGSGGALMKILSETCFVKTEHRKDLVILGGGLCRRTPNYALRGKALITVGTNADGRLVSCLEAVLSQAMMLFEKCAPGLMICCADIVLDARTIQGYFSQSTAFCVDAAPEIGARHGVMFQNKNEELELYLQKEPIQVLRDAAERFGTGNVVPVDAGWLYFSSLHVDALRVLSQIISAGKPLNLFTDLIPVSARETEYDIFLTGGNPEIRSRIWSVLREYPIRVCRSKQPFTHYGTSAEILSLLNKSSNQKEFTQLNSIIDSTSSVGNHSILDSVELSKGVEIGAGCLVTDIALENISIPDNMSVFGLRLRDGKYVTISFPIEKSPDFAPETSERLWNWAVFYPDRSFSQSYLHFRTAQPGIDSGGMTLEQCLQHADFSFYMEWRQYLIDAHRVSGRFHPRYHKVREELLQQFFSEKSPCSFLKSQKDRVSLELPVRVNFSGTWTDCMPYCIDYGGEVINASITVNGIKPILVCAERIPEQRIEMCNADIPGDLEVFNNSDAKMSPFMAHSLHCAVFRTLGIGPDTKILHGLRLSVSVHGIMKGSGLGTSSILLYGCFLAMGQWLGTPFSESDLLNYVFIAEQLMGTGGGWQDQGAVVGGGLRSVCSMPGIPQNITSVMIESTPDFLNTLSERLFLVYTGQRHFGRFIVKDVMDRYLRGDSESLSAFRSLTKMNAEIKTCIEHGDLQEFAKCFNQQSTYLSALSPEICDPHMRALMKKCMTFASACCPCGAGGGGYLAVLLKSGVTRRDLETSLKTEVLDVAFI